MGAEGREVQAGPHFPPARRRCFFCSTRDVPPKMIVEGRGARRARPQPENRGILSLRGAKSPRRHRCPSRGTGERGSSSKEKAKTPMLRSWKLGTAFGIPLYVHSTFLLVPALVLFENFGAGGLTLG